jgi:ribosomal 30S subunit maturation factor RimM
MRACHNDARASSCNVNVIGNTMNKFYIMQRQFAHMCAMIERFDATRETLNAHEYELISFALHASQTLITLSEMNDDDYARELRDAFDEFIDEYEYYNAIIDEFYCRDLIDALRIVRAM